MSTTTSESTPAPAAKVNPFARLAGAIVSPGETFRDIAARPEFLVALIFITLASLAINLIVAPRIDLRASVAPQYEKMGMSEEQIDKAVEMAEKLHRFSAPITAVFVPLMLLVIALVCWVAFKLFGSEGSFKQFFSIVNYAWLPQVIKGAIIAGLASFKERLTAEEMVTMVKSNPGFLTSSTDNPVAFSLLSSIDFFTIWSVILLIIGFSFAAKWPRSRAAALVIGLFILLLLGKAGMGALQGLAGGARG